MAVFKFQVSTRHCG